MYDHVLVPIAIDHGEGTQQALKIAAQLASPGGKITALTVVEPVPGFIANELPEGQVEKTMTEMLDALKREIGGAEAAEPHVVHGHPGRTIVDYAVDNGADCIVIASHKPGLSDYFLGSTAARVVRHAPCAVHVVR